MLLRKNIAEPCRRMDVEKTQFDRFLEVLGWVVLIFLWFFTLYNFKYLPVTIPTHFDGTGQPNEYGSKLTFLVLPLIGHFLFS